MDANAEARIRIPDQLINAAIAAGLPPDGAVRSVTVHARGGNAFDATVVLRRPVFAPPLHAHLEIARQPSFPRDPVLALRVAGGAGGLLKMAAPFLGGVLPPGVRLEGEFLLVDLKTLMATRRQDALLAYAKALTISTEESVVIVDAVAGIA